MNYFPFYILLVGFAFSCTNDANNSSSATSEASSEVIAEEAIAEIIPTYEYTTISNWDFNSKKSKLKWFRVLDQKATKKKVKLFGAMVDVELGPMKMEMNGNVVLKKGELTTENELYKKGLIVFDMATFNLSKEKGEGLFNVKDYPHSTLEFLSFTSSSDSINNYNSTVKLTIQKKSKEYKIPVSLIQTDSLVSLKSSFKFNTLDFPLRDNTTKEEVNKDQITVKMDLKFDISEIQRDSVRTN